MWNTVYEQWTLCTSFLCLAQSNTKNGSLIDNLEAAPICYNNRNKNNCYWCSNPKVRFYPKESRLITTRYHVRRAATFWARPSTASSVGSSIDSSGCNRANVLRIHAHKWSQIQFSLNLWNMHYLCSFSSDADALGGTDTRALQQATGTVICLGWAIMRVWIPVFSGIGGWMLIPRRALESRCNRSSTSLFKVVCLLSCLIICLWNPLPDKEKEITKVVRMYCLWEESLSFQWEMWYLGKEACCLCNGELFSPFP